MNTFHNEVEMQRKFAELEAAGKRRYELRELSAAQAQHRAEQRSALVRMLKAVGNLFRRPLSAATEKQPTMGTVTTADLEHGKM